ncbi:unnamed protein product [Urochloa humidicola]
MLVRTHPAAVQQVKFRYFASVCCLHLQCSSHSVVLTVKGQAAARSQIHTQWWCLRPVLLCRDGSSCVNASSL